MSFKRLMILATMMAAAACGDDSDESSTDDTVEHDGGGVADASLCSTVTYATFGRQFMDHYCASCHAASKTGADRNGAPKDDVFDSLKQVQQHKTDIQKQVKEKSMPFALPGVPLPTDAERAQFDGWMNCGPN
jgi:uncharacterized membrane protein